MAVLVGALLLVAHPGTASAAATLSVTSLKAIVTNGTSVTATTSIASSTRVTATYVTVCVRSSTGANQDFAGYSQVALSPTAKSLSFTATFAPGTYSYFTCVYTDNYWQVVGATKAFTTSNSTVTPPPTGGGGAAPSGVAMPVGNLPGWKQVFTDDFTIPLARGAFPGGYSNKWLSYSGFTDTSKVGDYDQSIISAQNGTLDLYLHTVNGRPKGAAPIPLVNGQWGGQTYGRFSVRMRADNLPGYGTGFLLWADSENWNDGEIDFPESGLDNVVKGYNHCPGNASVNCLVVNTNTTYSAWHTYTIDWTPSKLSYLIDNQTVGSTTSNIPYKPLHWVMQVATTGVQPAASTAGHLLIDWATIYTYSP